MITFETDKTIADTARDVQDEVLRAMNKHGSYNSLHEAYAVLLEEVDELWDEVRKQTKDRLASSIRKELIQIAAVAIQTIHDLDLA